MKDKKTQTISINWNGVYYHCKNGNYWKEIFINGNGWQKQKSTKEEFDSIARKRAEIMEG